ncbi:MAG TPA: L,D-transpeptidase [Chitinophagales bacterium]|nr:L,D-transpeptidase [Chitinophagales bacterium]
MKDITEIGKIEKPAAQQPVEPPVTPVAYRVVQLNDSVRNAMLRTYDSTALRTVLALNRIDKRFLSRMDSIVVPDTLLDDFNAYAPFPRRLHAADSVRKLLLCSYPSQAVAAYENGSLVRWGPASFGKKSTPTPTGYFHTNWKAKRTVSTDNPEWILDWYFNLTNFRGVSLHEYELPGFPASHACVRLREDDARWIYHWADQWRLTPDGRSVAAYGTPVVIYGEYDFGAPRPWFALPENPNAISIDENALTEIVKPHVSTMLQRQAQRDSVLAAQDVPVVMSENTKPAG